jgi:predicted small secreted protein
MSGSGRRRTRGAALALVAAALALAACASTANREGLDVAQLPVEVRADYHLFARRCSKCHPLARALNSGIHDDAMWIAYVNRMRRQPGSGISPQDTEPILRFLHYYSLEQQRDSGAPAP